MTTEQKCDKCGCAYSSTGLKIIEGILKIVKIIMFIAVIVVLFNVHGVLKQVESANAMMSQSDNGAMMQAQHP